MDRGKASIPLQPPEVVYEANVVMPGPVVEKSYVLDLVIGL